MWTLLKSKISTLQKILLKKAKKNKPYAGRNIWENIQKRTCMQNIKIHSETQNKKKTNCAVKSE
jgi:hypothetical protein